MHALYMPRVDSCGALVRCSRAVFVTRTTEHGKSRDRVVDLSTTPARKEVALPRLVTELGGAVHHLLSRCLAGVHINWLSMDILPFASGGHGKVRGIWQTP